MVGGGGGGGWGGGEGGVGEGRGGGGRRLEIRDHWWRSHVSEMLISWTWLFPVL